jgi:hypothetical protein
MNQTEFAVSRYENRNGVTSWRVSGWLHGVRIRKNFLSREEAAAESAALEIRAAQIAAGMRSTATFLTEDQLRDAESVYRRLDGQTQSLPFYVDFALNNYREPDREKPLSDAVGLYLAVKAKETERALLSARQLRSICNELATFQGRFPRAMTGQFTPPVLKAYLERGEPGLKTYNIGGQQGEVECGRDVELMQSDEVVAGLREAHRGGGV